MRKYSGHEFHVSKLSPPVDFDSLDLPSPNLKLDFAIGLVPRLFSLGLDQEVEEPSSGLECPSIFVEDGHAVCEVWTCEGPAAGWRLQL
jgi:hypothetical protein